MKSSTGKFEIDIPCEEEQDACDLTRLNVTENGIYMPDDNHDGFYQVDVNVEGSQCDLTTKTITANGTYDASSDNVDGYSQVTANVPNSYTAGDEGKVVDNGALVAQGSQTITQNGTYDTTLISELIANISGGSTNILKGTTAPTAGQGDNGSIYLQYGGVTQVRYIKFVISKVRASGSGMQFSELDFYDGANTFSYPAGTTVTSDAPAYAATESVDKIIDGSTNTKYYTATNPTSATPITIIIDLGSTALDLSVFNQYRWYTANDSQNRDPVSFDLYASADGNSYELLDSVADATITTTRKALAYTGNITIASDEIFATYLKVNNAWQNLIGSDIDDVNTGA